VKKVHKGDKGTQMPRCMTVTTGKRYQLAESWTEVTCAKCQAARRADEKAGAYVREMRVRAEAS
jgi:hypothetical protein